MDFIYIYRVCAKASTGRRATINCETSVNWLDLGLVFSQAGLPKPHQQTALPCLLDTARSATARASGLLARDLPGMIRRRTEEALTRQANRLTWTSSHIFLPIASCSAASASRTVCATPHRCGRVRISLYHGHICRSGDQRLPSAAAVAHTTHLPTGVSQPGRPVPSRLA